MTVSSSGRDIADAHFHWWDVANYPYAWLASTEPTTYGSASILPRRFGAAEYEAVFGPLGVKPAVHLEAAIDAGNEIAEVEWVAGEAAANGTDTKNVAGLDYFGPDVAGYLDKLLTYPDVVGVRRIITYDPDQHWTFVPDADVLRSEELDTAVKLLGERDLVFDAQIYPPQMGDLLALANKHPDTRMVLNHSMIPRLWLGHESAMDEWTSALREGAKAPNIALKLGGFGMPTADWLPELVADLCRRAVDIMGPHRIMFGSNAPVAAMDESMVESVQIYRELAASGSPDEEAAILSGNVASWYHRPGLGKA